MRTRSAIAAAATLIVVAAVASCASASATRDGAVAPRTSETHEGLPVAQSICSSPTEARDWEAYRNERIDSNSWNVVPAWPPAIPEGVDVRSLAGQYLLTMVRQLNSGEDVAADGRLELVATTSEHSDLGEFREGIPLIGWASIDLAPFGRISLAHSLDQRDPGRPGVQASYWRETRQLRFSVGNSIELRRGSLASRTFDAGISFYVFSADSTSIVGRWSEGSPTSSPPRGYFCAVRDRVTPP